MPYAGVTLENEGMVYVPLLDVLNDFKLTIEEDDYIGNANDVVMRNIAMRGIREFGFDVTSRVKSIKRTINTANNTVALPDDFVDVIKVGVVNAEGLVEILVENKHINYSRAEVTTADADDADQIPSDDDSQAGVLGEDTTGLEANTIADTEDSKTVTAGVDVGASDFDVYVFDNFLYQGGMGRIYGMGGAFHRGEYRINLDQARIEISTSSTITEVILEYVSDEARSTDPIIHVYAEEALRSYIYYKLIERKSTVPIAEKGRARQEYYNERRKAKARLSNFTKSEALKTIRKNFKPTVKN